MKKIRLAFVLATLALAVSVQAVFAQDTTPDPTQLIPVLTWLMTVGAAVAGAMLVSFLSNRWPAFNAWSANTKFGIQAAASLILGLGARAILQYVPPETLAELQPWFLTVVMAVAPLLANQWTHASINKPLEKK